MNRGRLMRLIDLGPKWFGHDARELPETVRQARDSDTHHADANCKPVRLDVSVKCRLCFGLINAPY